MAGKKRKSQPSYSETMKKIKKGHWQVSTAPRMYMPRTPGGNVIAERKINDQFLTTGAIAQGTDWTGTELDPTTTNCLFAPALGNDINTRVGRKVSVHKIKINGVITCAGQANQTTTDGAEVVRLILYQDKQTNATQAQGEDLMSTASASSYAVVNAFQNSANFGRFQVLKDKRYVLNPPSISYDGINMEQQGVGMHFKININFKKPVIVHFNATNGGTVADIVDNSFHIIAATSNNSLAGALSYVCRTTYTDV